MRYTIFLKSFPEINAPRVSLFFPFIAMMNNFFPHFRDLVRVGFLLSKIFCLPRIIFYIIKKSPFILSFITITVLNKLITVILNTSDKLIKYKIKLLTEALSVFTVKK